MSELQVSLVFSVIIWVNVIREITLLFSLRVAEGTLFFADASILVRGNKTHCYFRIF